MDFAHSDEQLMLRDAARSWMADRYPPDRLAEIADDPDGPGADAAAWSQLDALGWLEAAAADVVTAGVIVEAAGYGLLPSPFVTTVALAGSFGADVTRPTTLAFAETAAPRLGDTVTTSVDAAGLVTGHKLLVPDLAAVTHAVVSTTGGPRLVAVADARVVLRSTIDRTRRLGELVLDATPSTALPDVDPTAARTRILTLLACESVGVTQRVLELAAAHVSTREQFGRIIGTYQGVSHKVADMYSAMELSRSLAVWAAWSIDAGADNAPVAAAAAKAKAGSAAVLACEQAIQVHGGIGFTWDSVLHRYYKRAQWIDAYEGGGGVQRATVAAAILAGVA